ncbi:MAG: NUDIX domain-containing protein, partial [Ktedonobacterales bacterium]
MVMRTLERVERAEDTDGVMDVTICQTTPLAAARSRRPDVRRLVRAIYRLLPLRGQQLALRLGAPKVTMGACAVIQDERGRILVAHHTYRRSAWGLPGGLIDRGEQPEAALAREMREELDARAIIGPMLCAESEPETRHVTLYY